MKIEIKSVFGKLLFEYDCEDNSIKKTVEKAIKENIPLSSADLNSADLNSADLRSADLPIYCKWGHSIQDNKIKIGCKLKSIEEWDLFFDSNEVYETKRNTEDFKQIQAVYLAYKAYLTHIKTI